MVFMPDYPFKKPMAFTAAKQIPQQISSRFNAPHLYLCGMMLTLTAAAALFATSAQAQTEEPTAPAPVQAALPAQPAQPAKAAAIATAAPKHSAKEIERAFNFMDTNKDGKISREEAAGFRGVARHFDEADTNKDGFLSREEFENALNGVKPQ